MKYENAEGLLPDHLLKEIQRYAAGKLLYIPKGEHKHTWGESSGYRSKLQKRNQMIRNKYAHGVTIDALADEYYLSLDSLKKIIYSKQHAPNVAYAPTVYSAVSYTQAGMLEEWVQSFLLFSLPDAKGQQLSSNEERLSFGVIRLPLRLIEHKTDVITEESSLSTKDSSIKPIAPSDTLPPLVVNYENGKFFALLQPTMLTQLKEQKTNVYPSIIVMQDHTDYKRFMQLFGSVFKYVEHP